MRLEILSREKHVREDGWLAELVSMKEKDMPFDGIHSYIVMLEPGRSRANHYHKEKEEWLALGAGRLKIILEDPETKERVEKVLGHDDEIYNMVYVPVNIAHSVKNIGQEKASVIVFSKFPELEGDTVPYKLED